MTRKPIVMTVIATLSIITVPFLTMSAAVAQNNNSSLFGPNSPSPYMSLPPVKIDRPVVQSRPTVELVKCTNTHDLACKAPFCLKVRTEKWDELPSDLIETPEVYIQFNRDIRDRNGQSLPSDRVKVTLAQGSDHQQDLWFQTDDGPFYVETSIRFTASLIYPDALKNTSPDNVPFDIKFPNWVVHQMSGDACNRVSPSNWFVPWW